jgi:hypothetical protein
VVDVKYFLVTLILQIISTQVFAEKIKSQIHSIDIGQKDETHLIKLISGRVAFIGHTEKQLLKEMQKNLKEKRWLELTLDKGSNLEKSKIIATPIRPSSEGDPEVPYTPSVISYSKAQSIFSNMRKDYQQDSQCFNRAHIWTFEEFQRSETYLNKVFLFFTSRYIRNYRYHWWFHVTPMAYVGGKKFANWRMLDRRYTHGPLSPKTWTDIFIYTKRACKVVSKYSSYENNQRSQDCYLIQASMYYLVPSDLERLESESVARTDFEMLEVEYARWEAFKTQSPRESPPLSN